MADTIRTRSAVIALLPDNTSGEISPQDIRDFLVSVWGVYGALSVYDNASAQSFDTTPAKVTAFAIDGGSSGTTVSTVNKQITVNTDGVFEAHMSLTLESMTVATEYTFHIALNGTRVSGASTTVETQSANDIMSVSVVHTVSCSSTDIITVLGESDDAGGQNATIKHGQLFIKRIY